MENYSQQKIRLASIEKGCDAFQEGTLLVMGTPPQSCHFVVPPPGRLPLDLSSGCLPLIL